MKHKTNLIVLCCFLSAILISCSNNTNHQTSDIEKKFLSIIPVADMNKTLQLSVDGDQKMFQFDSQINVTIHNVSRYSVMFDAASPPKILAVKNSEWIEVENEITYSGARVCLQKVQSYLIKVGLS